MLNLETRTTDPALSFHIQNYLDATEAQRSLGQQLKEFFELDHKREAAMTHIALCTGLIETVPVDSILPPDIWNASLAIVHSHH
jgi:hypothetical protein